MMPSPVIYKHMQGWPLATAEREVLEAWTLGFSRNEIAQLRGVSPSTVAHQVVMLKSKLGFTTDEELRTYPYGASA